jgi:hypothetical protein
MAVRICKVAVRMKKAIIIAFIVAASAALGIVALIESIDKVRGLRDATPTVDHSADWEEIVSTEWEFSAQLPIPIEHKKASVQTPFGNAPLDSYTASVGPTRFTVAVSEYNRQVALEFTEDQRYKSSDQETPKLLGGKLAYSAPIRQHGVTGREQIIEVPSKGTIHTRMFLIGNRSYQIQVAYPPHRPLDATTKKRFLDSLVINYRQSRK